MRLPDLQESIGDVVRSLRGLKGGMTQRELAERMAALGFEDWSQRVVSDIEKGRPSRGKVKAGRRDLSVRELYGLALIFGKRPSDLFVECFSGPLEYDKHAKPIPGPVVRAWLNAHVELELSWNSETKRHSFRHLGVNHGIDPEALLTLLTYTGAKPKEAE